MKNEISDALLESSRVKEAMANDPQIVDTIEDIADTIVDCYLNQGKVLVFGNGGSAADAQHITGELVGRYKLDRKGLPAIALHADTSILTAWSNDYDFADAYRRQAEALAKQGDVLWGLSTSGNSPNVIRAIEEGKRIGAKTIAFTGAGGGKLAGIADYVLRIPSADTPRIQEGHMTAYHIICGIVENRLYGARK